MRSKLSILLLVVAALPLSATPSVAAKKFETVYSFCAEANCADGSQPAGPLIEDSAGDFYGVTASGGATGNGSVYAMVLDKNEYVEHVLYSFCSEPGCTDGSGPGPNLIIDTAGNLYGVTASGGANGRGTAFEITLSGNHSKGKLHRLYDFCSKSSCSDGQIPVGGLTYRGASSGAPYDGTSDLYGVTYAGSPQGVAYVLHDVEGLNQRIEQVIYMFCLQVNCNDGYDPTFLLGDPDGNLFGETDFGGADNWGVAFEISKANQRWSEAVLYSFCQLADCADGRGPVGPLALDSSGTIYGTTAYGGTKDHGLGGTLYAIIPNGQNSIHTVLHNFCARADCVDGSRPSAGVVLAPNGDIFGTATMGGEANCNSGQGCGTTFLWRDGRFVILHSFCQGGTDCGDGVLPNGLVLDPSGRLFGTTQGGLGSNGTIYRLKP